MKLDVARERLANQWLTTPGPESAADVVRGLGAVQAQDYPAAKWALSQRTRRGESDAAIEAIFAAGGLLRTHVLRPTWHLVAPEDIRWMLALTAPRVSASVASYNRRLELTRSVFRRSHAAITRALQGGKHLTRGELRAVLERARIGAISAQRLAHLMLQAELDAIACSGANRGKQLTYALLDERVPPAPAMDRDAALAELTRRYFRTRGPATARDFAWWSSLSMIDVRRGLELTAAEMTKRVDGTATRWLIPHQEETPSARSAHLLPNYDEYFIGYKDRSAIARRLGDAALVVGGDALVAHVVVIDGQLVGGWKRVADEEGVTVELTLLDALTDAERRRVTLAARKFADFLGRRLRLRASTRRTSKRL